MADWKKFTELWAANFRPFRADDGLPEWSLFVSSERTDLDVIRAALEEPARRFADSVERGENPRMPTLAMLKKFYFNELDRRKQQRNLHCYGKTVCGVCRGFGRVYVAAPRKHDVAERNLWPDDCRRLPFNEFNGIEICDCVCRRNYPPELRFRIEQRSFPLVDPDGQDGDKLLLATVGRNR